MKKINTELRAGLCVLLFGVSLPAFGQTNTETNAGIQFNFSPPGPRSLALGGAFLSLADDATAAVTNPAGLTQLEETEIMVEYLSSDFNNVAVDSGRDPRFGAPSGRGVDTEANIVFGESEDSTDGISFLSFVYPAETWSLAIYRHELANFEVNYQRTGPFRSNQVRLPPVIGGLDLKIIDYGASYAYQICDEVSVGIGVSESFFSLTARRQAFESDTTLPGNPAGSRFGPPLFADSNYRTLTVESGEDTAVSFNVGMLLTPNRRWRVGVSFRDGPEFEMTTRRDPNGSKEDRSNETTPPFKSSFRVPDSYGIGLSFLAMDQLFLSFDFIRVLYSQMTTDLGNIHTDARVVGVVRADDANELHFGVEWAFLEMNNPFFLRAGAWYDPDHKFTADPSRLDGSIIGHQVVGTYFQEGTDEMHYSFGAGIQIKKKVLIDAAVDFSDLITTATAGFTFRFGA